MAEYSNNTILPTVHDALELLTVDELKKLLKLVPSDRKQARKSDIIAAIAEHLHGEKLKPLWQRLDDTQQQAVAEAVYTPGGSFDAERFHAKYGRLPLFEIRDEEWSFREAPSLL